MSNNILLISISLSYLHFSSVNFLFPSLYACFFPPFSHVRPFFVFCSDFLQGFVANVAVVFASVLHALFSQDFIKGCFHCLIYRCLHFVNRLLRVPFFFNFFLQALLYSFNQLHVCYLDFFLLLSHFIILHYSICLICPG